MCSFCQCRVSFWASWRTFPELLGNATRSPATDPLLLEEEQLLFSSSTWEHFKQKWGCFCLIFRQLMRHVFLTHALSWSADACLWIVKHEETEKISHCVNKINSIRKFWPWCWFIKLWVWSSLKISVQLKAKKWRTPKSNLIFKSPALAVSFYKSQPAWKSAQVDSPHILPSAHPYSTVNDQCKELHECFVI